jgi:hypothetical protein
MALWKRAGTCFVKLESPDGMLLGRSAGTTDTQKAQECHDRLKAELWDLAYSSASRSGLGTRRLSTDSVSCALL